MDTLYCVGVDAVYGVATAYADSDSEIVSDIGPN